MLTETGVKAVILSQLSSQRNCQEGLDWLGREGDEKHSKAVEAGAISL